MTASSNDNDAPQPAAVSAYLRSTEWELVGSNDFWATFRKHFESDEMLLEVPLKGQAPDYPRRFRELVDDLRKVERRPTDELVRDIRSSTSDVIRIRLFGNLPNGRISVEEGARAFQKTRDLLLAVACAAVEKRPVYSRKKFVDATGYVNRAQRRSTTP